MMILAPEKTTTEGACILIVDDVEGVRENLGELFEVVGYSILTARSATEALQLSQTVMDEYAVRILMGTFERPVSALELIRRLGIPIAACYRRIKELEGRGIVYCERELPSRNGRGPQLFRSRLKSVRI